jgi:protoheme IX farnesyltransferase
MSKAVINPLVKAKAYLALTKPRVIELLLITTVPTMILAQRGMPSLWLVLATLLGGALSAGSANAFNCYLDADIDQLMGRTAKRPLVTGELSKREAYVFAWILGVFSVLCFGLHAYSEASHTAEHRLGWRRRGYAGANRLGGGHQ